MSARGVKHTISEYHFRTKNENNGDGTKSYFYYTGGHFARNLKVDHSKADNGQSNAAPNTPKSALAFADLSKQASANQTSQSVTTAIAKNSSGGPNGASSVIALEISKQGSRSDGLSTGDLSEVEVDIRGARSEIVELPLTTGAAQPNSFEDAAIKGVSKAVDSQKPAITKIATPEKPTDAKPTDKSSAPAKQTETAPHESSSVKKPEISTAPAKNQNSCWIDRAKNPETWKGGGVSFGVGIGNAFVGSMVGPLSGEILNGQHPIVKAVDASLAIGGAQTLSTYWIAQLGKYAKKEKCSLDEAGQKLLAAHKGNVRSAYAALMRGGLSKSCSSAMGYEAFMIAREQVKQRLSGPNDTALKKIQIEAVACGAGAAASELVSFPMTTITNNMMGKYDPSKPTDIMSWRQSFTQLCKSAIEKGVKAETVPAVVKRSPAAFLFVTMLGIGERMLSGGKNVSHEFLGGSVPSVAVSAGFGATTGGLSVALKGPTERTFNFFAGMGNTELGLDVDLSEEDEEVSLSEEELRAMNEEVNAINEELFAVSGDGPVPYIFSDEPKKPLTEEELRAKNEEQNATKQSLFEVSGDGPIPTTDEEPTKPLTEEELRAKSEEQNATKQSLFEVSSDGPIPSVDSEDSSRKESSKGFFANIGSAIASIFSGRSHSEEAVSTTSTARNDNSNDSFGNDDAPATNNTVTTTDNTTTNDNAASTTTSNDVQGSADNDEPVKSDTDKLCEILSA